MASASPAVHAHVVQALPSSDFGLLPTYVAQGKGFLSDEGLDVELPVMNSNAAIPALTSGQVQFASGGSANRAAYQGAPLKTIFYGYTFPTFIAVGTQDVKSVEDVRGKTVAIASPGSSEDFAIRKLLQVHGIDVSEVNLISLGQGPQRVDGVMAGQIQFTVVNPDLAATLESEAPVNILGGFGDILPIPFNGFAVTDDMLRQQPDVVLAWLRAHVRALQFIKQQPDDVATLAVQQFNLTPAVAANAVQFIEPAVSADDPGGTTRDALILNTQQDMQSLGMTGDPAQIGLPVHDFTLLRQAQRELGVSCTAGYQCQ